MHRMMTACTMGLALLVSVHGALATDLPPYDPDWKPSRDLTRVFAKLRAGEPITVASIGGSVTVVTHQGSWASMATDWLREQFPDNDITHVDGALGGRGPGSSIWRFKEALLPAKPDLFFIEYAVNAYRTPEENYKALDAMVLQMLRTEDPPDIVFVYVGNEQWQPSEGWESEKVQPVGRHYGFPEVLARAHLQSKLAAGDVKWEDVARDNIHPNAKGHAIYAEAVIDLLQDQMQLTGKPTPLPPIPPPFYSDEWTTAHLVPVAAAQTDGPWQRRQAYGIGTQFFQEILESDQPGATLTLTANTTSFAIAVLPTPDSGSYAWSVDGGPQRTKKLRVERDLNGRVWTLVVAEDLPPGEHTLTIMVLPPQDGIEGNWVRVGAFGVTSPEGEGK